MPGTGDYRILQSSFANRPTPVRTDVINCIETTINVEDGYFPPMYTEYFSLSGWNVFDCPYRFEVISLHPDMLALEDVLSAEETTRIQGSTLR